jgi:putative ABC transport system permease protein
MTLFASALMFWLTIREVAKLDRGYRPQGLFSMQVSAGSQDSGSANVTRLARQLTEAMNANGVAASVAGGFSDFGGGSNDHGVYLPGADHTVVGNEYGYTPTVVSEGYFTVMGTPLTAGRAFNGNDVAGSMPVAIVSESFVRRAWGSGSAIGKTLIVGKQTAADARTAGRVVPPTQVTVVGVAHDISRSANIGGRIGTIAKADVYLSDRQARTFSVSLDVRQRGGSAATLQKLVERQLDGLGRALPVNVHSMQEFVDAETESTRALAWFSSAFALACLVLALMGVYGVIAFGVEQRTREIGIRIALGAQGRDVLVAVMRPGIQLIGIGLAAGLLVSYLVAKVMNGFIVGSAGVNLGRSIIVAVVFGVVALIASYVPARRAARLDPVDALRTT